MNMLSINQNFYPNFKSGNKIPYALANQSRVIINAVQDVNPNMQKLKKSVHCKDAKTVLEDIKEKIGIEQIFNDGGFSLNIADKLVKVFVPNSRELKIREVDPKNINHFKLVEIEDNDIQHTAGFTAKDGTVEDFLTSIFEKLDFPILQLRRLFNRADVNKVIIKISPKAVLKDDLAKTSDDIIRLFDEVQERISSISNGVTKSKIKNAYPNARPSIHGSNQLEFADLGIDKTHYSINTISIAAKQRHLVIKTTKNPEEKPQVIIVDPKHRVLKEKHLGKVYHLGSNAIYYTQQEIDSPLFAAKFQTLKNELEKYNEYLKEKIANLNSKKAYLSTGEIGLLDKQTLKLVKKLMQQFDDCKAKMLTLKNASKKRAYKDRYGIETIVSSPSLIFKKIDDNGQSLHLSFPTIGGIRCMKMIIEKQNGNVGKTWFIKEDKLVKFNAKNFGRTKSASSVDNYFSQEEINNSGLSEMLQILKKRLDIISKNK